MRSSVKIRNVSEIHKRLPRCLCYLINVCVFFLNIYISSVFGTRVGGTVTMDPSFRVLADLSITTTSQVMPDEWSDGCRAEGLPKRDGVAPPVH